MDQETTDYESSGDDKGRDEVWNEVFQTYYKSYYFELLANALVNLWQRVDEVTKVLVAITASSSAVASWAIWATPELRPVWAVLASIAAILSIVHATLGVLRRLKDYAEVRVQFMNLRLELENIRYNMRLNPEFSVESLNRDFKAIRKRFADSMRLFQNDVLATRALCKNTQNDLNNLIVGELDTTA